MDRAIRIFERLEVCIMKTSRLMMIFSHVVWICSLAGCTAQKLPTMPENVQTKGFKISEHTKQALANADTINNASMRTKVLRKEYELAEAMRAKGDLFILAGALGDLEIKNANWSKAKQYYETAQTIWIGTKRAENPIVFLFPPQELQQIYYKLGDIGAEETYLKQVVDKLESEDGFEHEYVDALTELANFYMGCKQYSKQEAVLIKVMDLQPHFADDSRVLSRQIEYAKCLKALKKYEQAEVFLEKTTAAIERQRQVNKFLSNVLPVLFDKRIQNENFAAVLEEMYQLQRDNRDHLKLHAKSR